MVSVSLILLMVIIYPVGLSGTVGDGRTSAGISTNNVTPAVSGAAIVYVNPVTVAQQSVGGSFTIQIKVANMGQFNGWDIEIVTSQSPIVINATSLSISGNIFALNTTGGSAFEIVHCVNGAGTGCTSNDGPGVVHSAFGDTTFTSGNGLLFSVTFKVVGINPYLPIMVQNSLISSSSPSGVPHSDQNGNYGIPLVGGGGGKSVEI